MHAEASISIQIANIATFVTIDSFISKLSSLLTRRPISGYRSVTLEKNMAADHAFWQKVAQVFGDRKSVDWAVAENMDSAEVTSSDDKANSDKKRRKRGDGDDKKKKKGDKGDAKIDIPQNCIAKNEWNRICFGYNRKSCPVLRATCRKGCTFAGRRVAIWQAPLSSDFGDKE